MRTSLEPPWHLDGSGFSKFIWVFGRNYVEAWPQWEGPDYKIDPWSFDKDPEDDGFQKESRFPGENDFRFHVKLEGHITASCFFCFLFWVWSLSQNLQLRCTIWIFQCAIRHTNEHRLLQGAGSTCGWKSCDPLSSGNPNPGPSMTRNQEVGQKWDPWPSWLVTSLYITRVAFQKQNNYDFDYCSLLLTSLKHVSRIDDELILQW